MSTPLLATKLYIPPLRPHMVARPRLVEQLNEGLRLGHKLTLISAPAGFGKTTLVSDWLATCGRPAAWLSLDTGDNDAIRFLVYLIAALQTIAPTIGAEAQAALQSPQPPSIEVALTNLLNDIASVSDHLILVLDDYHVIDAKAVDAALGFLLERLPPQLSLVIVTREDPQLPVARLRARGHLTELRAADLRFSADETADFLTQVMGLTLTGEDISLLAARTEGWVAGLQLAAISLKGHADPQGASDFIASFSGGHRFVLDYLMEEVLQRQPEHIQTFLLRASVLDRMCGALCDAVTQDPAAPGQETLEYLERANLFVVPLDNERRWYRYHHLFAELLRQRLGLTRGDARDEGEDVAVFHQRASQWYEDQGLEFEAFQHAAAAQDIDRAERLIEGRTIPRHSRDVVTTMLDWLASLPTAVLNARPSLWVRYASLSLVNGQTTGVEEKLQAAEAALQAREADENTRDLAGQIAALRATRAVSQYQAEPIIAQSRRALEYLAPDNHYLRATAHWTLGVAYQFQGDRSSARAAHTEAIALSQASGDVFTTILATIGLGNMQEADNELYAASQSYQRALQLMGDTPQPIAGEAHLPLARICYEWNDLDGAERHGRESLRLARRFERVIDRFILSQIFLARLQLAHGDLDGAAALLAQAQQTALQQNFVHRLPDVAAAQVAVCLRQGNVTDAARVAHAYPNPASRARVALAQGDPAAALEVLEPWRRQVEAKGGVDEQLQATLLQAIALQAQDKQDQATQSLLRALTLAEPGGIIRSFVDEGQPMADLLANATTHDGMSPYIRRILAAFDAEKSRSEATVLVPPASAVTQASTDQPLIEPLSQRELEVLRLIAQGRSNQEISERLYLALTTVKGHNRNIFSKLQVQRRTEAVARARELGLL